MIYVDSSVVLAHVLAEDVRPPTAFWHSQGLVSSRLTEYESWVRLHAYGKAATHGRTLAMTLASLDLLSLDDDVCARSRAPFPIPVRTIDALHLAAADYWRTRSFDVSVATYDERMARAAQAMSFPIVRLG